jgi:uncharacterized protein
MTAEKQRIELLDIVRGLALLGILLMNIRLFSGPYAGYFNPNILGELSTADKAWWDFTHIVANQKFMAIFSMLFGASTAIICDGIARRKGTIFQTFSKRIFILLLIGLIHAHLIWRGDILVPYALASFIPFFMRNVRWQYSAILGLVFLGIGTLMTLEGQTQISALPPEILNMVAVDMWQPTAETLQAEIKAYQGGWFDHFSHRTASAWHFETEIFLQWGVWRIGGTMLLGLALYRSGFLGGKLSGRTYGLYAAVCLLVGFAIVFTGLKELNATDWAFPYAMLAGDLWNYWGSILVSIGYISLIGFLLNSTSFRFGFNALANVGKTALSNYLFQSVACVTVFYGFGGGQFGELMGAAAIPVILGVWAAQLVLSGLWLKHYDKGPLEGLWHRITYARWLPGK